MRDFFACAPVLCDAALVFETIYSIMNVIMNAIMNAFTDVIIDAIMKNCLRKKSEQRKICRTKN